VKSLGVNDIAARNNSIAVNLLKGFIFAPAKDLIETTWNAGSRGGVY
jgi:hypothetical protein